MPLRRPRFPDERDPHVATRTLACLAASIGVALLAILLWPPRTPPEAVAFDTDAELVDPMEVLEILPTSQPPPPANLLPPPPPPLAEADIPPIEVEDFVEIEDLDIAPFRVTTPAERPSAPGPPAPPAPPGPPAPAPSRPGRAAATGSTGPTLVRQPDVVPQTRFAPFPEYPDEARRAGVRARAVVEVLISEGGRILEAEIVERVLIDRRGRESPVAQLPHGMDAIALATARRYVHSPAKHEGRTVRTYTRITLDFGTERGG
ncbi:energy transducer TonB [Rubricoccus marinus]|uniref:Uncharacterized protein n=1 Tax=Rubricoccus marinus TaxID=716817 RepID=A0A259TWG5_9BACT|nr:energy transducer TonB [Rubricoccus marinus]OZC02036.1 hypothetical protein BSZ36_02990 [Rubricoccus marinus]